MEYYLGEIRMFAGNFAPAGWALCDGALLPISSNAALFSILGTLYGGNGVNTFGLPDFRGRVPMHFGQSAGLSTYVVGQHDGAESTTLTTGNMPMHSHGATFTQGAGGGTLANIAVSSGLADEMSPVGNIPAVPNFGHTKYPAYTAPANSSGYLGGVTLGSAANSGTVTIATTGGSQPFSLLQPFLVISFIISLSGDYPTRA